MNELTLAVVTKNRPRELSRCLDSVRLQTVMPATILIVDNDVNRSAYSIYQQHQYDLPIIYVHEPRQGVPYARNAAIQYCRTTFLGFVDDDCVLDPRWVTYGLHTMKIKRAAYIVGTSRLLNPRSMIARAQYYRQHYWFTHEIQKLTRRASSFNVDTKNIMFDVRVIRRAHITFDPSISVGRYDSADTDLGFQCKKSGLSGYWEPKMVIYHTESATLIGCMRKAYNRGRLAFKLCKKWHLRGEFVYLPDIYPFVWLKRLKWRSTEFKLFTGSMRGASMWEKIIIYGIIKIHDGSYFHGYIGEALREREPLEPYFPKIW